MANSNQNNNQRFGNQYDPQSLLEGLSKVTVPQNKVGEMFREKTSSLQVKIEDMLANTYSISEIDHVFIAPRINKNGQLTDIFCRAYFDTQNVTNGNIVRKGFGTASGGKRQTAVALMGGAVTTTGDFELSDQFKKVFAPLALSDDDKLHVNAVPRNKDFACIDLDFFAVMSLMLAIGPNDPYNFSVVDAKPISKDDYVLLYSKFIETSSGKRGRHKGRRINYQDLDREFARQNEAYASNNGRSF